MCPAENYRLQSAYEKHLIIKIVLVRGHGDKKGHEGDTGGTLGGNWVVPVALGEGTRGT